MNIHFAKIPQVSKFRNSGVGYPRPFLINLVGQDKRKLLVIFDVLFYSTNGSYLTTEISDVRNALFVVTC
jgi:hypothetical protein